MHEDGTLKLRGTLSKGGPLGATEDEGVVLGLHHDAVARWYNECEIYNGQDLSGPDTAYPGGKRNLLSVAEDKRLEKELEAKGLEVHPYLPNLVSKPDGQFGQHAMVP